MIYFMAPLSKQEEFFVPECEQAESGSQSLSGLDSSVLPASQSGSGEDYTNQDNVQTPVDENVSQDTQEVGQEESPQLSAEAGDQAKEEGANKSNNGLDGHGDELPADDEQASDDSSSSFEVLRTGPTE